MADDALSPQEEATLALAARHALHDEELIAALVDGALDPADAARAQALVDRCQTCAAVHGDVLAINAAIKASGTAAQVAQVRFAPRDFRLTPEMAGITKPAPPIARLTSGLATALGGFRRPLGVTFAALGLVGVLVGSVNLGTGGTARTAMEAQPSAAAPAGDPGAYSGFGDSVGGQGGPLATSDVKAQNGDDTAAGARDAAGASTILIVGSIVLLVAGALLFVAGRDARAPAAR